jgi:hypothetical protein
VMNSPRRQRISYGDLILWLRLGNEESVLNP